MDETLENANDYSVLAKSAYLRNRKDREELTKQYHGDRFTLLPDYSDKEHSVYYDTKKQNLVHVTRGTDGSNAQGGRIGDLATDVLLSFGLETLTPRYKRSEKLLKKLQADFPNQKIVLSGHSLGGTISSELSHKYDLENHSFQPGTTFSGVNVKRHKSLHPELQKRKSQNHSYIVGKGIDPVSLTSMFNPFVTTHVFEPKELPKAEQGLLGHHSLSHFFKD